MKMAILLRCHRRTWQLKGVLKQCLEGLPQVGIVPEVILMPDKPTIEVSAIVDEFAQRPNVHIVTPPECTGHRWAKTGMEGLNYGMAYIDKNITGVEWVHFRDDDEMLGVGWEDNLASCLSDKDTLAWLALSLYIWEDLEDTEPQVNLEMFHLSPIIFRYIKGDRFPTDGTR